MVLPEGTILKTVRHSRGKMTQHEYQVATALDVGMFVDVTGSGVAPHGTAAEDNPERLFVKERRSGGMEWSDSYPVDEIAQVLHCSPGAGLHGLLAVGHSVSHGDELVSDGAGALRPLDTAGGDVRGAVVATVDLKEGSINRPAETAKATTIDSTGAGSPIGVPIEVK